jgi:hypothetical protein
MGLEQATSTLDFLIGFNVNLYVGEEIFKGKLIGVETDHIILENDNNNIFYYSIDQIQAIAKNTKEFQGQEATAEYFQTQSLIDLLESLKNTWVTILCLNKQKFSGVLSQVDKKFATLISGEERIFIMLPHISNVFKGFIKENKNENEEKNQDQNQAKNQDRNQVNNQVQYQEVNQDRDLEKNQDQYQEKNQDRYSEKIQDRDLEKNQDRYQEKKKEEPIDIGFNEKADHVTTSVQETNRPDESSVKVVASDSDKESKVWSHSIKDVKEKLNVDTTQKINTKMKNSREDEFQLSKREKDSKKVVVKSRENEGKQHAKEVKFPKNVKATKKQEPVIKGKDVVQPTSTTLPSKVEQKIPQAKSEEVKRKEDSIRSSRFVGEPANLREIDRAIFSGWPVPRNRPRL